MDMEKGGLMNHKERYNQIIDEAYAFFIKNPSHKCKDISGFFTSQAGQYIICPTLESFVDKIKTDSDFSENWNLKIEERELSLNERKKLYENEFTPGMEVMNNHWLNSKLTTRNIPTKLITLTYNNETIEIYE